MDGKHPAPLTVTFSRSWRPVDHDGIECPTVHAELTCAVDLTASVAEGVTFVEGRYLDEDGDEVSEYALRDAADWKYAAWERAVDEGERRGWLCRECGAVAERCGCSVAAIVSEERAA